MLGYSSNCPCAPVVSEKTMCKCIDIQLQDDLPYIYRGSKMSAHVLLNLLNKLRKMDKM